MLGDDAIRAAQQATKIIPILARTEDMLGSDRAFHGQARRQYNRPQHPVVRTERQAAGNPDGTPARDVGASTSAADCGSGGRWFESTQLYQQNQNINQHGRYKEKRRVRTVSAIALEVERPERADCYVPAGSYMLPKEEGHLCQKSETTGSAPASTA